MALNGISAPAEGRIVISNQWLEANKDNKNAVIDIPTLSSNPTGAIKHTNIPPTGVESQFSGRAISIRGIYNGSEGNSSYNPTHENYHVDLGADYGTVNCRLNNDSFFELEDYRTKIDHPDRVRQFRPYGTYARGIRIKL